MSKQAREQALEIKARFYRGLSDVSRLSILEALRDGPQSVGAIVDATGLTQSNASNHLACLHDCGLVSRQQRGRFVYYSLSDDRVDDLLRGTDGLLRDAARGVYQCMRYAQPPRRDLDQSA